MTRSGCPGHSELLAYADDELSAPRQAEVYLHVQQCCDCRIWLNEARTIRQRIRDSVPVADDSAGLEVLRARLADQQTATVAKDKHWRSRAVAVPVAALSLALIVTLSISVFTSSSVVEGGSTFARWLSLKPFIGRFTPDLDPDQIPVRPTGTPRPSGLPFELGMVSEELGAHSVERHYVAPNGLWIRLVADRDAQPNFSLRDLNLRSFETVDGREVLLLHSTIPDAIGLMSWSDGDVLMMVMVMEQPVGNLNATDALKIVEAFIEEGVDVP